MPVEVDIVLDVSDRLYAILKKDTQLIETTIKKFESTIKDVITKLDKSFDKLTKQLEGLKR